MTTSQQQSDVYLVVGAGARAHALAWALSRPHPNQPPPIVHVAPGNPGIGKDPKVLGFCHSIEVTDLKAMADLAQRLDAQLTVVGPEVPLGLGIVDVFERRGLLIWGPSAAAAQLECSKLFAKCVMQRADVPTAHWAWFDSVERARAYVRQHTHPVMIKASGLAGGKGSFRSDSVEQSDALLDDLMVHRTLGSAGDEVIIEEVLCGHEVSFIVATDGTNIWPFDASQDHKRLLDGAQGPNTGGMGAIVDAAQQDDAFYDAVIKRVVWPTLKHMRTLGLPYRGFLYVGLMVHEDTLNVLEFNVRLGDPEAQALLFALDPQGLGRALMGILQGDDVPCDALRSKACASCVVLVTQGYPGEPVAQALGHVLCVPDLGEDAKVFYGSVSASGTGVSNAKGRVLGVTARAPGLELARTRSYDAVELVKWPTAFWRRDVGAQIKR